MAKTPKDFSQATPPHLNTSIIIAKGIAENLPAIISSLREIYDLRTKERAFKAALQARCDDMEINSQNFAVLVQNLTELSKSESADEATKDMYRDLIRALFELFTTRSNESDSFSRFLNR